MQQELTPTQIRRARRKRTKVVGSCDGKVRHQLRSAAEREARAIGCVAYSCQHCGGWHVGHRRPGMPPWTNPDLLVALVADDGG